MALEIERKFLVRDESWREHVQASAPIRQGYFCRTPLLRARIRVFGDKGFITLKSEPGVMTRYEFEYEIPKADALEIIKCFSIEPLIAKTRYDVIYNDTLWAVDVFTGANTGLVIAEVELVYEAQKVAIPPWAGLEVTGDRRYGNSNLARFPYTSWSDETFMAEALW
ncbi:CYTH domain-containing protein [Labrys miyagiensis]|uniref:CYTH domain-containing protein n=1 Tax=Labrys miyagiensis TaxID=346912 RepID=A0ABQ6CTP1_9HYPH|nr:CYTH domain-containing protein [Labrys miyagiensis]GLS23733.1 CYTH domain-containing protein [Labrys miyagiensis]